MKTKVRKGICILTVAAMISGGMQQPVLAGYSETKNQDSLQVKMTPLTKESGVTVTNEDQFMNALKQQQSPITVNANLVIGDEAEQGGRMKPVMIPANTVIEGTQGSSINSRSPIQILGDGVCFRNIELKFSSGTATGSVAHREIFLAGHSLTLDNVSTWLEGGGNLGSLGGDEDELLPTVYAGGYPGTVNGEHASLTVENANTKTMFQAVYMGHGAGSDDNVPYTGTAVLNLDPDLTVREKVDTSQTSEAQINIAGSKYDTAKTNKFNGNEHTVLTLSQSTIPKAVVENIGHLVLKDEGCLQSETDQLQNVTLQNGGCLDLNGVKDAKVHGDFQGVEDQTEQRGVLVLNKEGSLSILGAVAGTTQFQTDSRQFPGIFNIGKPYVLATQQTVSDSSFVLSQKSIDNGYQLNYQNGSWSVNKEEVSFIGDIQILSAPEKVDLRKIKANADGAIPDQNTFLEVVWYDSEGIPFTSDEVEEYALYEMDYVIKIRTDYWQSDSPDILDKTDWYQPVSLVTSEEFPGKYFLQAEENAQPGDYTFLFCSDYFEDINTVADVKALKNTVKAAQQIIFYDEDLEEEKPNPPGGEEKPDPPGGEETPAPPGGEETPAPPGGEEKPDPPGGEETPTPPGGEETPDSPGGEETPTPPGGEETPTPPGGEETPTPPGGEETPTPPGGEETPTPPGGEEKPDPPGGEENPNPPGGEEKPDPPGGEQHTHSYTVVTKKATLKKDGSRIEKCSCGAIKSQKKIYYPKKITLSDNNLVYNGKGQKPQVKITDSKGQKINSSNYTLKYKNNIKVGAASVTITFKNDYSGSLKKTFTIVPKSTNISKLTAKCKGFTVKWKKQSTQITGYEIAYSTSSKFTKKTTKTVSVKNAKATSKTISNCKPKKKYYIRVRTYKAEKMKGKTQKFYSSWSKVKSVKTKK